MSAFKIIFASFAFLLPLTVIAADQVPAKSGGKTKVIVTTSLLEDVVKNIVDPDFDVRALVQMDEDAHVFEPSPADAQAMTEADIVIYHGHQFEPWLEKFLKSNSYRGLEIFAGQNVQPLKGDDHDDHGHKDEHHHGQIDPHVWQDPNNVIKYVTKITAEIEKKFPNKQKQLREKSDTFKDKIRVKHGEILKSYKGLGDKKVITTHDGFHYYEQAYGIRFYSPLSWSTDAEPSAKQIAQLIKLVRKEKIQCLFFENMTSHKVMTSLEKEVHGKIHGQLVADSLSTKLAPTYLEMMDHNFKLIHGCLSANPN